MTERANGALLIARGGFQQIVGDKVETLRLAQIRPQARAKVLLRDRNGALWIGTRDMGLLHVHGSRTDSFSPADGLSGDDPHRLFEDREGTIWFSTAKGLDRFRQFAAPTISVRQGLSGHAVAVLAS